MQSKQCESHERLIASRQNYRCEIRRLDHQAMLKSRRALIIHSVELSELLKQLDCRHQPSLEKSLIRLEEETAGSQHLELLTQMLSDYQEQFHQLYLPERYRHEGTLLEIKLKVLINLTTLEAKVLRTEIVLSFIGEVLGFSKECLEHALSVLRNMLLSKSYCDDAEAFVVRGGWLRRLQEFPKCYSGIVLEVFSVVASMPRTQIYLRERLLEMCLMFRQSLNAIMNGDECQLLSAYRIIVELIELNSNYCQQLTKEELSKMLTQLTYSAPTIKNYATCILAVLSLYTQDPTLAQRLVRQQGLKIVFAYLGLNNINNRKGGAVVIFNCLKHLPKCTEVESLATSLLFNSRLLYMYIIQQRRLENDTVWIASSIIDIYRHAIEEYERDFVESLIEAGILSILARRMIASEDRQEKIAIAELLSAISRKAHIKLDIASFLNKNGEYDPKKDEEGEEKSLFKGGFYGSIYRELS